MVPRPSPPHHLSEGFFQTFDKLTALGPKAVLQRPEFRDWAQAASQLLCVQASLAGATECFLFVPLYSQRDAWHLSLKKKNLDKEHLQIYSLAV